jgi:phosphatidylserine/phosphatidylglycerophosphate/cardiolipin synthase-like enzyme
MKENDNYNINGDLSENIIQTNSFSLIKESLILNDNSNRKRRLTVRKPPNEINSEFILTSITSHSSTTNEILEKKNPKSNDDMIILDITGKNNLSIISWKIYKTHKQIRELFNQTKKELAKKNLLDVEISTICKTVSEYTNGEIFKNLDQICKYIIYLYNKTGAKKSDSFREGLRISATSFIYENNGIKPFEGYAYKKAEPRCMRTLFKIFCFPFESCFFKSWNKRWIILKDDMICYLNDPNTLIGKNVYWFDENINITTIDDTSLQLTNLSRTLTLKFNTEFERDLWEKEINTRIDKITNEICNNEYQSFTSQKINCGAKWFVDGHDYFEYLQTQLLKATESVFITDWFLSPELALKRPVNYNNFLGEKNITENKKHLNIYNANRLMDIFYVLAKNGVKIYILLFCEPTLALAINSLYTKRTLQHLHQNIKITRHPKGTQSILWSHHEKLVIIDQKIAFVGGLDLCWGRYDTKDHPVVEEKNKYNTYFYPGCDYINERQVDLHNVERFYEEQLPRDRMPRMPWHDVHTMVEGPIVSDIVRHFVERWNDARFNRRDNGLVAVGTSSFSSGKKNKKNKNDKNIKNNIMIELQSKNYDSEDEKVDDINNINNLDIINTNSNISSSTSNSKNIMLSDDELPINDQSFDSDDGSFEAKKKEMKSMEDLLDV